MGEQAKEEAKTKTFQDLVSFNNAKRQETKIHKFSTENQRLALSFVTAEEYFYENSKLASKDYY